ncbi:MAG: DUF4249 domain-containing protein [Bacteroidales bacterium]
MRLNKWIIGWLLAVLVNGCIEPFEPDIEETGGVLVVDGRLTDAEEIQTIAISRSTPYNSPQFQPVSGCVVRVEDGEGAGISFPETGAGYYQSGLEPGFLSEGKAYKLIVITPDDNRYESAYDTLLACAPIERLSYQLEVQGTSDPEINYYGIRFYADVSGSTAASRNYMWTYEETWEYLAPYKLQYAWDGVFHDYTPELHGLKVCYLTELLSNFEVGTSSLSGRNELLHQPLHFVSNQTPRLREKYSLLVMQHSLSGGAFLYWDKLKAQYSNTGSLYETQPAKATGNICKVADPEEKVLGYFFVSQVKKKRITVSEDFDFPIAPFNCPLDTANSVEDFGVDYPYFMYSISFMGRGPPYAYSFKECHDCTYRGGVTTKPEYWDD